MARIFSGLRTQLVDFPNLPTDVFFCTDTKQAFLGNARDAGVTLNRPELVLYLAFVILHFANPAECFGEV